MSIVEQKRAEIARRLSALDREFDEWKRRSEAGQEYQKHHYQIRRLTNQLIGFKDELQKDLKTADPLEEGRKIQQMSLELHRIWEFFRGKLAQRSIDWYRDYLLAADELAWAIYKPVRDLAVQSGHVKLEEVTEPPLVFFNGASSPLTFVRNARYSAEPSLFNEAISTAEFQELLKELPVPVIGLPWFELEHLPDALFICHEVGHVIEDYLRLTPRLEALLKKALESVAEDHRRAWRAWLGEIFADICGGLAAGPSFVDALIHFLACPPALVANEIQAAPRFSSYPTTTLRVRLNLTLLRQTGFADEAAKLENEWLDCFGKDHLMPEYETDIEGIVKTLVEGPYPELGNASLAQAISYTKDRHHVSALSDARYILEGRAPMSGNARVLITAAAIAYTDNPKAYAQVGQALVLRRIREVQDNAVRGAGDPATGLESADKARGAGLLKRLQQAPRALSTTTSSPAPRP